MVSVLERIDCNIFLRDRCNGFIWIVLVLVQDIIDIDSDDILRVAILQQKRFEILDSGL